MLSVFPFLFVCFLSSTDFPSNSLRLLDVFLLPLFFSALSRNSFKPFDFSNTLSLINSTTFFVPLAAFVELFIAFVAPLIALPDFLAILAAVAACPAPGIILAADNAASFQLPRAACNPALTPSATFPIPGTSPAMSSAVCTLSHALEFFFFCDSVFGFLPQKRFLELPALLVTLPLWVLLGVETAVLRLVVEAVLRLTVETVLRLTVETVLRLIVETVLLLTVETVLRLTVETVLRLTVETVLRLTFEAVLLLLVLGGVLLLLPHPLELLLLDVDDELLPRLSPLLELLLLLPHPLCTLFLGSSFSCA